MSATLQTGAPEWARTFATLVGEKSAFLLTGNTKDLVTPSHKLRGYLNRLFREDWTLFIWYDRANGITFETGSGSTAAKHAKLFDAILTDTLDGEAPKADATANALASVGIKAAPKGIDPSALRDPAIALPALDKVLRTVHEKVRAVVVIDYAETIAPHNDVATMSPADRATLITLQEWALSQQIAEAGHKIVLVAKEGADVHPALRAIDSRVASIAIPPPNADERLAFVNALLDGEDGSTIDLAIERSEFARLTAGLTRLSILDICVTAKREGLPVTAAVCIGKAKALIEAEYGGLVEFVNPTHSFADVGGLDHVKRALIRVRDMIVDRDPAKYDDEGYPVNENETPMGILFSGCPGGGKTFVADAFARECGMAMFRYNPAAGNSKWRGESEGNFGKVLRMFEAVAPCVVFIDEYDQAFRRGSGDGDSSSADDAIFKMWLEFLGDEKHRGRILVIGATNKPQNIEAAAKRPGRIDLKIPFLPPTWNERLVMLTRMSSAKFGEASPVVVNKTVVDGTEGWTAAELSRLTRKAAEVLRDGRADRAGCYEFAMSRMRSTTGDVKVDTLYALAECDDLDLLPDDCADTIGDRDIEAELEEAIAPKSRLATAAGSLKLD